MLDYSDFYDLAVYGNENWKGSFTPKEIACNAFDYYMDYTQSKWSAKGKLVGSMIELLNLLKLDGSEEVEYWKEEIEQIVNC